MSLHRLFTLVAGVFLFGVAAGIYWPVSSTSETSAVTCRPSAPHKLPDGPKVLFWGNSIAFDNSWRVPGYRVVNCAIQGMTAHASLERVDGLPKMDFDAVVLVFGTVELVRGNDETDAFASAIVQVHRELQMQYNGASFFALSVPAVSEPQGSWRYAQGTDPLAINQALRGLKDATVIDVTEALAGKMASEVTYDGIHFTEVAYDAVQIRLLEALTKDRSKNTD